ncbi:hypothetical protein G6F22_017706 [Rhizopus arrhizus]|nr:hypothetical protein G6F22_017706 [Rhizopus arrhizus]
MIFDLFGGDFLTGPVDVVTRAPLHHQVAARKLLHAVTGAVEAVVGERACIGHCIVVVAANGVRAAGQQVTDFSFGHRLVVVVDHAHFVVRTDRPPLAGDDQVFRIIQPRVIDQAFGHAKHLLQRAAQAVDHPPRGLGHQLGASHLQHLQAGQVMRGGRRRLRPQQRQRRHQATAGHVFAGDQRERRVRAGAGAEHHAGTGIQRAEEPRRAHREVVCGRQRDQM